MSDVSYAEIMFNIVESLNLMYSSFQETQHEERDLSFLIQHLIHFHVSGLQYSQILHTSTLHLHTLPLILLRVVIHELIDCSIR